MTNRTKPPLGDRNTTLWSKLPPRSRWRPHVMAQEIFRDTLVRERRRADRFDRPFVLLLLELKDLPCSANSSLNLAEHSCSIWTNAIAALSAAVGETAILGWVKRDGILGAILPAKCGCGPEAVVRRELHARLDRSTPYSVRSHVYSPNSRVMGEWLVADCCAIEEHAQRPPARYTTKRSLDVAGSLALLVLLAPVFLLIAALLKLTSPGPIVFRQTRVGQMGRPFTMLKFRTMRADADPALHHEFVRSFIRSSAQLHPVGRKAWFKLTNDPRITPIGRILRKTSLDELPQLWNVLRGEMSLVGPRPPLLCEVEHYQPWQRRRVMDAKPGVTGLWQVRGRSRTTFDEMVRLDLRYARHCSLWTDIKILLATPRAVISGNGAA